MKKESLKGLVFDFDGVLVDSVDVKTRAFACLFESFGEDVVNKVVEHHVNNTGVTRYVKFHHYYREFLNKSLSDEEFERLCNRFSELVVEQIIAAPYIPGAREFLEDTYKTRACYVVTGTPEEEIKEIVKRRNMSHYFVDLFGSPKSKTDLVKALLQKHHYRPDELMLFGDSRTDLQAAADNGIEFVGIVNDSGNPLFPLEGFRKVRDFTNFSLNSVFS